MGSGLYNYKFGNEGLKDQGRRGRRGALHGMDIKKSRYVKLRTSITFIDTGDLFEQTPLFSFSFIEKVETLLMVSKFGRIWTFFLLKVPT